MASRRDGPLIVQNDRTVLLDVHHEVSSPSWPAIPPQLAGHISFMVVY